VLQHPRAAHAEYGATDDDAEYFIDELRCSLVGETMPLTIVDDALAEIYDTRTPIERYYCRFGLKPEWREAVHDAGLRVVGVDDHDGDVRILRLDAHRFFVLTLFVPQNSSSAGRPHPLIRRLVALAAADDG
jgi:CTP synthase (UTP-ammonia lyase)